MSFQLHGGMRDKSNQQEKRCDFRSHTRHASFLLFNSVTERQFSSFTVVAVQRFRLLADHVTGTRVTANDE